MCNKGVRTGSAIPESEPLARWSQFQLQTAINKGSKASKTISLDI